MTKKENTERTNELLELILIIEFLKGGIPQLEVRKVIGCDIHKVNKIAKLFKINKK